MIMADKAGSMQFNLWFMGKVNYFPDAGPGGLLPLKVMDCGPDCLQDIPGQ
jgi:hypothetical protein